jgi:tRNA threonylcarbamoyladenosine biosynthesis protein TsaE
MEHTWEITAETELEPIVEAVVAACTAAQSEDGAIVLALHGDLGAGKTTFMQHLARTLGVTETVVSPTFVIMKHYQLTDTQSFTDLYHLDAYRIEAEEEMAPLGFARLLAEPTALVAIEWAERVAQLLPPQTLHLTFTLVDTKRIITLTTETHG